MKQGLLRDVNMDEEEFEGELSHNQFRDKKMQDAKNFASKFIETIIIGQGPLSQLSSVLKARGFLLKDENESNYDPECIFLSDNSDKQDAWYLDKLLKENNIGYIFSDDSPYFDQDRHLSLPFKEWEVLITGEISKDKLNIFSDGSCGPETGNIADYSRCERDFHEFKKRLLGHKVEVCDLDPYIARLVKTLNAIGITTHYSCDGNRWGHNRKGSSAFIQFECIYDSIWLAILIDKFVISEIKLTNKWQIGEISRERVVNTLILIPKNNDWFSLYLEIQNVAEILYKKREVLRNYKQEYFDGLSEVEFLRRAKEECQNSLTFSAEFSKFAV